MNQNALRRPGKKPLFMNISASYQGYYKLNKIFSFFPKDGFS
jgi:hypothetical protein